MILITTNFGRSNKTRERAQRPMVERFFNLSLLALIAGQRSKRASEQQCNQDLIKKNEVFRREHEFSNSSLLAARIHCI